MDNKTQSQTIKYRRVEGIALFCVTVILLIGFINLNKSYNEEFSRIEKGYQNKTIVNLDKNFSVDDLTGLLVKGNYIPTEQDARIIAGHLSAKLNAGEKLPNLGTLNKSPFLMNTAYVDSVGGEDLKGRLEKLRNGLQIPDNIEDLYQQQNNSIVEVGKGDYEMNINIYQESKRDVINKILQKFKIKKREPVTDGTLVQLREYWQITPDSLEKNPTAEIYSIVAYAKTDANGFATFKGLDGNKYYSVLPVKKNYNFGNAQGTINATIEKGLSNKNNQYTFTETEHQIKPFDSSAYQQLNADKALTVRTPQTYKDTFNFYLLLFFLSWWGLHLFLTFFNFNKPSDQLILPILMTLTGIGTLVMYAIHKPLTDNMEGNGMVFGTFLGLISFLILSKIHIDKLFDGVYFRKVKFLNFFTKGYVYLIFAGILLALLWMIGEGPEGSGVKVNLRLGILFQPSEIIKFLVVIFFAVFFSKNKNFFQETALPLKLKRIMFIFIGLGLLLFGFYVIGDLGPAMVLAISFIVIYSMANKDSIQLITGAVVYIILLLACRWFGGSRWWEYITVTVIWYVVRIVWGLVLSYKKKKRTYESALFLNFVIAVFVVCSSIPGHFSQLERLQNRTAMSMFSNGTWNNEVQGGDQVAQGLWGLASGGLTGQGLGNGNSNVIPAFDTDMILESIGEELGWICLLLLVICLTMLIHRTWLIGRSAGKSFLFYLATGIAVVTGVQFLVISLGSTGIIPLTGITVPFLSSGRISVFINVVAFGIVLSISKEKNKDMIDDEMDKKATVPVLLAYFGISIILLIRLFYCQCIDDKNILIKPALTINRSGDRIVEDNPRIPILVRELAAANIYDRYEELLATSNRDSLNRYLKDEIISNYATKEMQQFKRRYYPFGDHLIFWTGDFNNIQYSYFWNENRGYMAESRHLAELRGFNNRTYSIDTTLSTTKYKASRFLPEQGKKYKYEPRNWSELVPILKAGIHSSEAEKLKKKQKDIHLTVDARLQTQIQNEMYQFFKQGNYPAMKKLRASVVVLNAQTGELLCSANYPLPNLDTLKIKPENYNDIEGTLTYNFTRAYTDMDLGASFPSAPGSTAKVISALAGFMKYGQKVTTKIYNVDPAETIYKDEPCSDKNDNVTMERAIVKSSNIYFINLVNDLDLYEQLRDIYLPAGIGIEGLTPYIYENAVSNNFTKKFDSAIDSIKNLAIPQYQKYIKERQEKHFKKMNNTNWGWAWGQGSMAATPLAMARAYSIVANNGNFVETKYLIDKETKSKSILTLDTTLTYYMKEEANAKGISGIAAKTGTPERVTKIIKIGNHFIPESENDGWFIFFRKSNAYDGIITVAIRIERLEGGGSQRAVYLAKDILNVIAKRENEIKKQ